MNPRDMHSIIGLESRRKARDNLFELGMEICAVKCSLFGQLFLSMLLAHDRGRNNWPGPVDLSPARIDTKHATRIIGLPYSVIAIPVLDADLVKFIKSIMNVRTYSAFKQEEGRNRVTSYIVKYLSDKYNCIWRKQFGLLHWENSRGRPLFNLDCYMKISRAALPNASFAVVARAAAGSYVHKKVAFREPYHVNTNGSVYDSIDSELI